MPDRFYLPLSYNTPTVEIDGTEGHHLLGVMRKKEGDMIELFDGAGSSALAEISQTKKRSATLHIQKVITSEEAESTPCVTLATAAPKGERFRWLVEKCTEIGIRKIIPLQTSRSVVNPGSGKIDKMRATIIAACKQCRRNHLMQLATPVSLQKLFEDLAKETTVMVGDPNGEDVLHVIEKIKKETSQSEENSLPYCQEHLIVIGPEGGLTEEELDIAKNHSAHLANFGSHILRIETAALVLGTIWLHNFSKRTTQW